MDTSNRAIKKSVSEIISYNFSVIKAVDTILDKSLKDNHYTIFCDSLELIKNTYKSINILLEQFKYENSVLLGINLLYRSILSYLITSFYLYVFIDENEKDFEVLSSEINVLLKEYLNSNLDIYKCQLEFLKLSNNPALKEKDSFETYKQNVISKFSDFFKEGKLVKNFDLRKKSNIQVFNQHGSFFKKTDNAYFISENNKLDLILDSNRRDVSRLKYLFKYFSQYHHFSSATGDLLKSNVCFYFQCYRETKDEVIYLIIALFRIFKFDEREVMVKHISEILHDAGYDDSVKKLIK